MPTKTEFLLVRRTATPNTVNPGPTLRDEMRDDALEMIVFDVGGGEAILLRRRKLAILVDGGAGKKHEHQALGEALVGYIRSQGLKLAAIVASHPHVDHLNAVSTILKATPTVLKSNARYFDNGLGMNKTLTDTLGETLCQQEPPSRIGLACLGSKSEYFRLSSDVHISMTVEPAGALDYRSIFMVVRFRQARFFLTGDAYESYELAMIDRLSASERQHDVLKVTHHGSAGGTSQLFVDSVKPRISVASSDSDEGHNLDGNVKSRLENFGKVYETLGSGDIRLRTDGIERQLSGEHGILIEVEEVRPGRLQPLP